MQDTQIDYIQVIQAADMQPHFETDL